MSDEDHGAIFESSYWRTLGSIVDGISFPTTFYRLFIDSSEQIRDLFADTHFHHQEQMLVVALVHISQMYQEGIIPLSVENIAHQHRNMEIHPDHFEMFLDALLQAVELHDPEFKPEVYRAWRAVMKPGIEYMQSKGHKPE